ncbi:MAG: hypothetical protein H0S85_10660 [Desulfovibrionaceae bacterium]|nr:hypothetical protein [Desulfovibrionaceae bacterium]
MLLVRRAASSLQFHKRTVLSLSPSAAMGGRAALLHFDTGGLPMLASNNRQWIQFSDGRFTLLTDPNMVQAIPRGRRHPDWWITTRGPEGQLDTEGRLGTEEGQPYLTLLDAGGQTEGQAGDDTLQGGGSGDSLRKKGEIMKDQQEGEARRGEPSLMDDWEAYQEDRKETHDNFGVASRENDDEALLRAAEGQRRIYQDIGRIGANLTTFYQDYLLKRGLQQYKRK